MIKISFKFFIALSLISTYVIADDFRARAKFKPQYPKSAYVKRISGYAVVDFLINEKGRTEKQSIRSAKCFNLIDKNGTSYFLEVNTLPGMTSTSLLPKSLASAGISFESLISKIVKLSK